MILCLFLTLLIITTATADYTSVGTNDYDFFLGTGNFDSTVSATTTGTIALTNAVLPPLIDDLDGDGVKEVVVVNGNTVLIAQNKTLDIIDSVFLTELPSDSNTSNVVTYDIDGDSFNEIIISHSNSGSLPHALYIFEYNGTDFFLQKFHNITGVLGEVLRQHRLNCDGVESCSLMINQRGVTTSGVTDSLRWINFNSTNFDNRLLYTANEQGSIFCNPNINNVPIADYDGDGIDEYVFSVVVGNKDHDDELRILYVQNNGIGSDPTIEQNIEVTHDGGIVDLFSATGQSCGSVDVSNSYTTPIVYDFNNGKPALETGIAYQTSVNEFVIVTYDSLGNFLDDYPETDNSDGQLISNLVRSDVYSDTGGVDFCVKGFDNTNDRYVVTCGSERTTSTPETREYYYNHDGGIDDLQGGIGNYNTMIHSTQQSGLTCGSYEGSCDDSAHNPSEILSTFGVFTPVEAGCSVFGNCDLAKLYTPTSLSKTVLLSDVESNGLTDLLILSKSNLFYLDDSFVNTPANVTLANTNPCITDGTVKQNSTVQVQVSVDDINVDDLVEARAIMYYGDPLNEQDSNWTGFFNRGTTFTFNFLANVTGIGTLRIQGRDNNNMIVDTTDLTFTVGTNGLEFGDTSCTVINNPLIVDDTTTPTNIDEVNTDDNAIKTAVNLFTESSGLGTTITWLIILTVVMIAIWVYGSNDNPHLAMAMSLLFGGLGFIVGILLGFIGVGVIIVGFIILIIGGVIWLSPRLMGTGRGGG